jgi:hypothetical protein
VVLPGLRRFQIFHELLPIAHLGSMCTYILPSYHRSFAPIVGQSYTAPRPVGAEATQDEIGTVRPDAEAVIAPNIMPGEC